MARTLMRGFAVCLLGLAACLRFGYDEVRKPAADGGGAGAADAAPADGSTPLDAASGADSATEDDAAAMSDAAIDRDASSSDAGMLDGAVDSDAAMPDGGADRDAAVDMDAAVSCPPIGGNYCVTLPALPNEPALDGVLECGLSLVDLPTTTWSENQAIPSDNHARYAVAWRPNGIYFYVEVDDTLLLPAVTSDEGPWCGDGVELYVDADGQFNNTPLYDNPGTVQLIAASPSLDSVSIAKPGRYNTETGDMSQGDWVDQTMVARGSAGYAIEALVKAGDLGLGSWSLASGDTVGIDLAINVSFTDASQTGNICGHAFGQYFLQTTRLPCRNQNCQPHTTIEAFCKAQLE